MILRGIFTLRASEIEWFYQKGASFIFPEYWDQYLAPIPEREHGNLVSAYYNRQKAGKRRKRMHHFVKINMNQIIEVTTSNPAYRSPGFVIPPFPLVGWPDSPGMKITLEFAVLAMF